MNSSQNPSKPVVRTEEGKVITTVKKETSSDIDFLAALKEANGGELPVEEELKPEEPKGDEKPEDDKEKPKDDKKKDEEDEFDVKKLSPRAQQEWNRMAKDRRRSDRELRELRDRLTELEARKPQAQPGTAPVADRVSDERPKKPDPLKFKTEAEFEAAEQKYDDDIYQWRKRKETLAQAQADEQQALAERVQLFNEQADAFKSTHDDYEEVMDSGKTLTQLMFGFIIEEGPEVAYHLMTNEDDYNKVFKLSGNPKTEKQAVKELIRIKIKLENAAADKGKAPEPKKPALPLKDKPIIPSGSRNATPTTKPRSEMTFKEKELEAYRAGRLNYVPAGVKP